MFKRGSAEEQAAIKQWAERTMAVHDALPRELRELNAEFMVASVGPGETAAQARHRCATRQREQEERKLNEVLQR